MIHVRRKVWSDFQTLERALCRLRAIPWSVVVVVVTLSLIFFNSVGHAAIEDIL